MRVPIVLLSVILLLFLLVDFYIYSSIRKRNCGKYALHIFYAVNCIAAILLIVGLCIPTKCGNDLWLIVKMWTLFALLSIIFSATLFVVIDLIASIPILFRGKRIKIVTKIAVVSAMLLFFSMWWGALINRFNINHTNVEVKIENLPEAFQGYKIVHISDLHVGTYGSDTTFVAKVVNEINQLNPDLIVFSGDIVNRTSDELSPFTSTLSRLKARDGVVSILGNHDYGDYYTWSNDSAKQASVNQLIEMQNGMGWELLLNSHKIVKHGNDSIIVIGVENIGDPPFKVYGDLNASYGKLSSATTKILLSHNPAHWDQAIADNDSIKIDLTLSGHTHAMQISAGRISPAALRYKHWGGLYANVDHTKQMYVNIGIGTVGMPMRFGATPEITLIELK